MTNDWKCPRCGATSPRAGGIERAIDRQTAMQRQGIALAVEALCAQGWNSVNRIELTTEIVGEIRQFAKEG